MGRRLRLDPDLGFHADAGVAVVKAAALFASAEAQLSRSDRIAAAVSSYYGVFHLGLSLMWLLPASLQPKLRAELFDIRASGEELPNKQISHGTMERYLCGAIPQHFRGVAICDLGGLFKRAQEVREHASYGPRVTYTSEGPRVGPCHIGPHAVDSIVGEGADAFTTTLRAVDVVAPRNGSILGLALREAPRILTGRGFPFADWLPHEVIARAGELLSGIEQQGCDSTQPAT